MTEKLQQTLNIEILKLPKEKQDAINSFDWVKNVEEIGRKSYLNDDEVNDLQLETGLMLIGLVDFEIYVLNIEKNIVISRTESQNIANEIVEKVFTPIAKSIEIAIKNKMKSYEPKWDKRINFIISGGDYSSFI